MRIEAATSTYQTAWAVAQMRNLMDAKLSPPVTVSPRELRQRLGDGTYLPQSITALDPSMMSRRTQAMGMQIAAARMLSSVEPDDREFVAMLSKLFHSL